MHVQASLKIMHVQSSQQIFQSADLLKGCPRASLNKGYEFAVFKNARAGHTKGCTRASFKKKVVQVQAFPKVVHVVMQASKRYTINYKKNLSAFIRSSNLLICLNKLQKTLPPSR